MSQTIFHALQKAFEETNNKYALSAFDDASTEDRDHFVCHKRRDMRKESLGRGIRLNKET